MIGTRYHEDDALAAAASAPRTSLIFTPSPADTFRVSYSRAFRTPSAINQHLDVAILQQAGPLLVPADAGGNSALDEERMTAYEIGYIHTFGDALTLTADVYRNEIVNSIDFFVAAYVWPRQVALGHAGIADRRDSVLQLRAGHQARGLPVWRTRRTRAVRLQLPQRRQDRQSRRGARAQRQQRRLESGSSMRHGKTNPRSAAASTPSR